MTIKLFTIGFTQTTAEFFFSRLKDNKVNVLLDIRLHPDGQLSGFAKKNDLEFFLKELIQCRYIHLPRLAPTDDILHAYRTNKDWQSYTQLYESLLESRGIPDTLDRTLFEENLCCFLCSEAKPTKCHRRLAAERMARYWGNLTITHI